MDEWIRLAVFAFFFLAYFRLDRLMNAQFKEMSEMHIQFLKALDAEREQRRKLLERLAPPTDEGQPAPRAWPY